MGDNYSLYYNYNMYFKQRLYRFTLKEGGDETNIEDYGITPVKHVFTDDTVILGDDENGYEMLSDGDYSFTSFGFYYYNIIDYKDTETTSYSSSTKVTTRTIGWQAVDNTDYNNYPPVKIYYKRNGEWEYLGHIKIDSGYYKFYDLEENVSDISSSKHITLPEGTTGIKAEVESAAYSVSFHLYPKAVIKNSDKVKSIIKDKDRVDLYNFVTPSGYDKDGNLISYNLSSSSYTSLESSYKELIEEDDIKKYGKIMYHDYDYNSYTRLTTGYTNQNKWVSYTNDPANRRVEANYTAYAYEYAEYDSQYLTKDDVFDYKIINEQRNGTFYDLLPIGMTVDLDSVKVDSFVANSSLTNTSSNISSDGTQIETKVSIIDNYKNSGRTLLIVKATVPEDFNNYYSRSTSGNRYHAYSGMRLKFKGYYSWDNIVDYGTNLTNTVAYQSESGKLSNGYADDASSLSTSFKDKDYFVDLNNDGNPEGSIKDTVYAQRSMSFSFNTASDSTFTIGVKTSDMPDYVYGNENEVTASGGGYYTYRLRYASQKNVRTKGLVIYDVLEVFKRNGVTTWQGKFENIDLTQIKSKGIEPVVYYSTKKDIDLYEYGKASIDKGTPKDGDLTNTKIWSTTPPEDLGEVTAIAIDLSKDTNGDPYILESEDSVLAVITMQAPSKEAELLGTLNAKALNAAWWSGTTQQGIEPEHYNFSVYENTVVLVSDVKVGIEKNSYVESGTEEKPKIVRMDDKIVYDIVLKNTSAYEAIKDVVVEDTLHEALKLDLDNVSYYFKDIGSIDNTTLVKDNDLITSSFDEENNKLTLTVGQIISGQELHILVPTIVKQVTSDNSLITNVAQIVSFNGSEYIEKTLPTYHEVELGDLTITKKAKGNFDKNKEFKFKITLIKPASSIEDIVEEQEDVAEDVENQESVIVDNDDNINTTLQNSEDQQETNDSTLDNEEENSDEEIEEDSEEDTDETEETEEEIIEKEKTSLDFTYDGVEFTDGVGYITLKAGESRTIKNLPAEYEYIVTEEDYTEDGYKLVSSKNTSNKIIANSEQKVEFVNRYVEKVVSPATGDNIVKYIIIGVVSVIGIVSLIIVKKKFFSK